MSYINTSGYKFTPLDKLEKIQTLLRQKCLSLELKGTILLSKEGTNIFICGKRRGMDAFYDYLPTLSIPPIDFKESVSSFCPFQKMLVKIKLEIISFGIPAIDPSRCPAPTLDVLTFKKWLAEGKEMILLDTRNTYEVKEGKFQNAIHLNIPTFRTFPEAVKELPTAYKEKTIVTYCTGGIRCEKAAPYLLNEGFKKVYQLDGGILKYLLECGSDHFEGSCFVFDERVAISSHLQDNQPS